MKTVKVDKDKLLELTADALGKVAYRLGAKPNLRLMPGDKGFKVSDCSGWVRWLLARVTDPPVTIGLGSWYQQEWAKAQGFKRTGYAANAGWADNRLRLAFIDAQGSKVGHVWLLLNGHTIECAGGKGVCRRPWDTKTLKDKVDACYVLTDPML